MNLKEHQLGCGCDSCQGGRNTQRTGMNNIDGYASGYELAPNQEIQPNQLQDPNFINFIIAQVLQRLYLHRGTLYEWAPLDLGNLSDLQLAPYEFQSQHNGSIMPPLNPCGCPAGTIGPDCHSGPLHTKKGHDIDLTKLNLQPADFGGGYVGAGGFVGDDDAEALPFIPEGLREKIRQEISRLYQESKELEEGSCGYTQSAPDGNMLTTPGGTKGMDGYSRTQQMTKGTLQERFQKLANIK